MKKMLFIYNPNAGTGVLKPKLSDVLDIFVKAGYEVTVYPTQCYHDAMAKAESYTESYDVVVCSGGDGTLDEVVTAMARRKDPVPIGYIPTGTTNDFANSLHISKDLLEAADTAANGVPFPCDVGVFNDDYFVYIAAFGLFTDVSYETKQSVKNVLGHLAYVLEGTKRLFNIPSYHIKITHDGETIEDDFVFGMVTNSRSVGGFKGIVGKEVIFDDGEFEVTLIKTPKNPIELNEIVASLLIKQIDSAHMYSFKAKEVKFESIEEIPWTLDGEFGGEHDCVDIRNWKQGMRIMVKSQMIQQLSVKGRIENTQILEEVGLETEEISEKYKKIKKIQKRGCNSYGAMLIYNSVITEAVMRTWLHGQAVKTLASHAGIRGSIPLGVTFERVSAEEFCGYFFA